MWFRPLCLFHSPVETLLCLARKQAGSCNERSSARRPCLQLLCCCCCCCAWSGLVWTRKRRLCSRLAPLLQPCRALLRPLPFLPPSLSLPASLNERLPEHLAPLNRLPLIFIHRPLFRCLPLSLPEPSRRLLWHRSSSPHRTFPPFPTIFVHICSLFLFVRYLLNSRNSINICRGIYL